MKVKIVGKVRRSGVSKSGRKYDFIELHFVAPARGVIGEAAQTMTLDSEMYPFENINTGFYDVQFDNRGTPMSMTPIQAQPPVNKQ